MQEFLPIEPCNFARFTIKLDIFKNMKQIKIPVTHNKDIKEKCC